MKRSSKKVITKKEAIEAFCIMKYGHIPDVRQLTFHHCRDYHLTEFGDLLRWRSWSMKISLVRGMKPTGRTSKAGKKWKAGFVIDQFYKTGDDGKSKRFWVIGRAKLMYMVFKGWTKAKVKNHTFFPLDKNPKNTHIDNIAPFKDFMSGYKAIYGVIFSGTLSNIDIIKIRRSKKTNAELGEIYGRDKHSISRIRNNRTYKDVGLIKSKGE